MAASGTLSVASTCSTATNIEGRMLRPTLPLQLPRATPVQPSMTEFVQSTKPMGPRSAEKLDEQLIKMIAKGEHPIVNEPEFKTFVTMLCPGYSLPTRKPVSKSLLPKMYIGEIEKAKKSSGWSGYMT